MKFFYSTGRTIKRNISSSATFFKLSEVLQQIQMLLTYDDAEGPTKHRALDMSSVKRKTRRSLCLKQAIKCIFLICLISSFVHRILLSHISWTCSVSKTQVLATVSDGEFHDIHMDQSKPLVAILEGGGYHDEVVLAFTAAFASNAHINTNVYTWERRWGSDVLLRDIMERSVGSVKLLESGNFTRERFDLKHQAEKPPDLIVSVTCRRDLLVKGGALDYLLYHTKAHLICVVHHSDRWEDPTSIHSRLISSWRKRNRIRFVALSPHVEERFHHRSVYRGTDIDTFAPIFKPSSSCKAPQEDLEALDGQGLQYITLQGNFEQSRRDYNATIRHFTGVFSQNEQGTDHFRLILLGNGNPPPIPEEAKDKVLIRSNLSYSAYYGLLQRSSLILTSFSSDKYLTTTASSTIAAGVIAGVPLVIDEGILEAYKYLDKAGCAYKSEDMAEMDAAYAYLTQSRLSQSRTSSISLALRNRLFDHNVKLAKRWIEEVREKQDRTVV